MKKLVVGVSVVLLTYAGFSTSAFAKGGLTGPSITPAQAQAIVKAESSIGQRAAASWDVGVLDQSEAPPLSKTDEPQFAQNKKAGTPAASPPYLVTAMKVYVPHQTSFPAQFLALVTYSNGSQNSVNYLVYVKPTKQAPWRATYQATLPEGAAPVDISLDKNGYASIVEGASAKKLKIDPARLSKESATFLTHSVQAHAAITSEIFAASFATPLVRYFAPIAGATEIVTFASTRYPAYSYRTRDGGALTFFADISEVHLSPVVGQTNNVTVDMNILDYPAKTPAQFLNAKAFQLFAVAVPPKRKSALVTTQAGYSSFTSVDWKPFP